MSIIEILQFCNSKYSEKNQVNEKQEYSPKIICALLSNDHKNKFPHYHLCTVLASISVSDKNIEYAKSNSKSIRLRVKSLKTSNYLVNGNQTSVYLK